MINRRRLLERLEALRAFGMSGNGVVRRFLSEIDMQARRWLVAEMRQIGLEASVDGVGNVFGRSPNPAPALLLGSHSDTQPTGGWLDGALGVIYALEIAQALGENADTRAYAVDVASWADEEAHFLGLLGSRSFCGELDEAEIDAAANENGQRLRDRLVSFDLEHLPRARLDPARYLGYVEAHIEQGPWLERAGDRVGVVTSIVGMRDLSLRFRGQQNHAGTTPMSLRADAAMALFQFANQVNQAFTALAGEHTVWTVGRIELEPNAPSIVPGQAVANLQFRDPEQSRVEKMQARVFELAANFNRNGPVRLDVGVRDASARAVDMDPKLQAALARAAQKHAPGGWRHMPSGASHDAQVLAAHLPAAMLFIPSIGGISHDFAEDSHADDIVLGCEVLFSAVTDLLRSAEET